MRPLRTLLLLALCGGLTGCYYYPAGYGYGPPPGPAYGYGPPPGYAYGGPSVSLGLGFGCCYGGGYWGGHHHRWGGY